MQANSGANFLRILLPLLFSSTTYAADVIPEPRQSNYPGTIVLSVDATDVAKRIFRVRK